MASDRRLWRTKETPPPGQSSEDEAGKEQPVKRPYLGLKLKYWRLITMALWLLFVNMMIFGVPHFSTGPLGKFVFWPNLSSRFLVYNSTTCVLYEMNLELINGGDSYFVNLIPPLLFFAVLILILGRVWCGWLCPIYLCQDLITRARSRLKIAAWNLPPWASFLIDRAKYSYLFMVIASAITHYLTFLPDSLRSQTPIVCEVCPSRSICYVGQVATGIEPAEATLPITSAVAGFCFMVMSIKIKHFYCRICPLGAMMAPLATRSLIRIHKDGDKCTRCRVCTRVCPMDIEKIYEEKGKEDVTCSNCLHCYDCIESCPEEGCLSVKFAGKTIMTSHSPAKFERRVK